ncbi:unnamed protein product [Allacma fusca]|uniref:USP domain-containing protein n=1 Tax=Allacma fusca TaxID=39272 RepID=A0A8J2Q5F5_9HEXA|nr:unnamed protein product [Allacma fusca]
MPPDEPVMDDDRETSDFNLSSDPAAQRQTFSSSSDPVVQRRKLRGLPTKAGRNGPPRFEEDCPPESVPNFVALNSTNLVTEVEKSSVVTSVNSKGMSSSPSHNLNEGMEETAHNNDVSSAVNDENGEVFYDDFPLEDMQRLDEMITNPRWVVPVLPGGQLEVLLNASINLCRKGVDTKSEACQRFFREGLTISFTKILTDDAVSSWKPEIHKCILSNSGKLVDLIVVKLTQDWFPLLELLGILFNPNNKFHSFNVLRPPESYPADIPIADDELYARHIETRVPKGWLVDLINRFGNQKGFDLLLERFRSETPLSVSLVYALLKPFGLCADFLTKHTVDKYFTPILSLVPQFLENLSDDDLKKETAKSDVISSIIKYLKCLQGRIAESDEHMRVLEIFRLRMIFRMLQVSSFNGKMNALNEINQVILNVSSYYPHHQHRVEEMEYLTSKRIAEWLAENQVLQIILRDSLHQPQYVEKMEKILRFIIKERSLTLKDLDDIWAAQVGKHDAIVKNVHDLLAKLAWDFSPEQLDHLFECFQASWTTANKRQREKLLELIRRLAEDDKDGLMAYKVLTLFWNLAHSNEVPTEIMDQALAAHVKVLDYSCSQQRDNQKLQWLNKSMDQLAADDVEWVIPAMKHMREIFVLYPEGHTNHKNTSAVFRTHVISQMQSERHLIVKVCNSLSCYMDRVRSYVKEKSPCDPNNVRLDGRYSHPDQIKERLNFLRFLLKEGQLYLCEDQANLIWQSLAESPAFPTDREMCFEWFSKLMGDEPDLDPKFTEPFFERKILNFDATLLTDSGMECFERFFKSVNVNNKKLFVKRDEVLMDDLDLIGTDYIWRVILSGSEDMAHRAIGFLRQIFTALGPNLLPNQTDVHEDFLSSCMDRLRTSYDTILVLEKDKDSTNRVRQEVTRACRVLRVLWEYISECDSDYGEERAFIPLYRAARAKNFSIYVRFPSQGSRGFEDMEVFTHSNETPAGLRRQIIRQIKEHTQTNSTFKLDLYYNGEVIDLSEDRRVVSLYGLRDKMLLQAKIVQSNMTNSPDSSDESSGGSPNHFAGGTDGPNIEVEESLPSVMMSTNERRMEFLCQLCGLGSSIAEERLREAARMLLTILPPCRNTEKALKDAFLNQTDKKPYNFLFNADPATVLYRLEVLYALLFPAVNCESEATLELLHMFFTSGGAGAVVEMLTKNNFMPLADVATKRSAYLAVLKLTKSVLTITSQLLIKYATTGHHIAEERLRVISDAVTSIPNPTSEVILRRIADHLSFTLLNFIKEAPGSKSTEVLRSLLKSAVDGVLPDIETIKLVIKLATSTASGSLTYFSSEQHQANREPTEDDIAVCEEALEVLTLSFVLNPSALEQMLVDTLWKPFLRQVLFHTHGRSVRYVAHEQLYAIATKCSGNTSVLTFFIMFLFEVVQTLVRDTPQHSRDVFHLLCNLLRYSHNFNIPLPKHEQLLQSEIEWLRQVKDYVKLNGEGCIQEDLLEGRICVARELTGFLSWDKKLQLGSDPQGNKSLIREIIEEFVFPWSKAHSALKKSGEINFDSPVQICSNPITQNAILDIVVSLCTGCYQNLKLTIEILIGIFNYSADGSSLTSDGVISDWEYIPPMGNRPIGGFVGLKNAGATCYMNSVLQQLFMVENIKRGILSVTVTDDLSDEGIDEIPSNDSITSGNDSTTESTLDNADDRKSYNVCILKQVQAIFGHLALSKLQYYIPEGLWKHFRLQGEPVNLREQQDAVEFFMSLIESVDDGLKALGQEQVMSKQLGGLFSDQKICKECPHRYSKEEPFSVISVDIRNHSNLLDSLEQYVKGELLEGADAYHCEKCNKKVVTVKRLCVKRLPPVLAIQLKRFEYDYERVCPIKYNDYFEFPRELDMEPYTVSGLAKIEGEMIDGDDVALMAQNVCTSYRLTGIVVHSGQASGGHYYSYISFKCNDGQWRWYKFDDGDVSECRMDDDEELKNQCFGGDYSGEVFDHMMKRMSFRRQKRWWNAYILFYTQKDALDYVVSKFSSMSLSERRLKVPPRIERSVLKENIEFMHMRAHFSIEYFQFIKKLIGGNTYILNGIAEPPPPEETEQLAILSVTIATMFLFSVGFRTKKSLRGVANDWYEVTAAYLKYSKSVRSHFATFALFRDPCRIGEYLLECPSSEVRGAFAKFLVFLSHCSKNDGVYTPPTPMASLSRISDKNAYLHDYILEAVLNLLRRDVSEYGRHLVQYFNFFVSYANIGDQQKLHLIKLDVPTTFIQVSLDDGPAPPIKYQSADLGKLYHLVSILIRSCDVSHRCRSNTQNEQPMPNPYMEGSVTEPLYVLPQSTCDIIYGRGSYFKKTMEEAYGSEETLLLLQFLSWENPHFSRLILSEILGHISYSYAPELKAFLDILLNLLRIEDTWKQMRLTNALKGFPDEKEGLIDIIHRNKQSHPKRAYLFIKCVTNLMTPGSRAHQIVTSSADLLRKWNLAVEWLQHELDRRAPVAGSYGYSSTSWSPPSNESSNGSFYLERSLSAKATLERAVELRIDPEQGDNEDDVISSEGEEEGGKVTRDPFVTTQDETNGCSSSYTTAAPPNTPPSIFFSSNKRKHSSANGKPTFKI